MSGGSGASAARSSTRAASTDLQAAQKKKEEREQRREQRRQQGEAAALAAAAAAAAAAAEAASESDQEGAAHMSNKQAKQEAYRKRQVLFAIVAPVNAVLAASLPPACACPRRCLHDRLSLQTFSSCQIVDKVWRA